MADRTCSIEGCSEPRKTRGFCRSHYARWRRHGDQMDRSPIRYPQTQLCTAPGCLRPIEARGYCVKHLRRIDAHGDPGTVLVEWDAFTRFRTGLVVVDSDCWEWQGSDVNQVGHGRIAVNGKRVGAHRWSYEYFVGPIPDGLVIDHLCKNPSCVNPDHLEAVTQAENVARADTAIPTINSRKTHCKYGHPLSGDNLMPAKNGGRPARQCRTCHNRRAREYQARKRARTSP